MVRASRLASLFVLVAVALSVQAASPAEVDIPAIFRAHGADPANGCFIICRREDRPRAYIRHNPRRCIEQFIPASTFKIASSLIALETGAVPDSGHVIRWDGTPQPIPAWERDHTLASAFRYSVVWYYRAVATTVGSVRMRDWVRRFDYGNEKYSGGSRGPWLDGDLRISAEEQILFLRRLYGGQLPISRRTRDIVAEMMVVRRTPEFVLRAKSGLVTNGDHVDIGWYVGWVERGGEVWFFAANVSGTSNIAARHAIARDILRAMGLIDDTAMTGGGR